MISKIKSDEKWDEEMKSEMKRWKSEIKSHWVRWRDEKMKSEMER